MSRKTAVAIFMFCLLTALAAPAFAQGIAYQTTSLPQQARIEGLTETMGAVVLQATAAGTLPVGSSITLLYSGTITNVPTIASLSGQFATGCVAAGCTGRATSTGTFSISATGNQLTLSVNTGHIDFNQNDYIVISQIRVNVNALGAGTTTVTATMSGTSSAPTTNPITFTQSTVPVASIVSPSLTVTRTTNGGSVQTCSITPKTFTIRVTERYPAALTSVTDETNFTPAYVPTNGTTVQVALSGIPSGMAAVFNGVDAGDTSTLTAVTFTGGGPGVAQTSTGGTITYTFVVTADSTATVEKMALSFSIGLPAAGATLQATAGTLPALGTTATVTATVNIGPVQTTPVIAFAPNTQGAVSVLSIADCVTNILFPYITNQNGYDTSFSVANTTADDLAFGAGAAAAAQSGTCTLSFWPTTDTGAVTLGTAVQATTPAIPSGAVYAFSQSTTTFSGQSGYMIAVCRFLNAHGFAFLTNGFAQSTGPQLSHGYLGLILPNPIGARAAGGASESLTN